MATYMGDLIRFNCKAGTTCRLFILPGRRPFANP